MSLVKEICIFFLDVCLFFSLLFINLFPSYLMYRFLVLVVFVFFMSLFATPIILIGSFCILIIFALSARLSFLKSWCSMTSSNIFGRSFFHFHCNEYDHFYFLMKFFQHFCVFENVDDNELCIIFQLFL